jgi:hypothetical protein
LEVGDGRDAFVVAVIVNQRDACRLRCGGEQQVGGRDAAMVAGRSQQELDLARSIPELA